MPYTKIAVAFKHAGSSHWVGFQLLPAGQMQGESYQSYISNQLNLLDPGDEALFLYPVSHPGNLYWYKVVSKGNAKSRSAKVPTGVEASQFLRDLFNQFQTSQPQDGAFGGGGPNTW